VSWCSTTSRWSALAANAAISLITAAGFTAAAVISGPSASLGPVAPVSTTASLADGNTTIGLPNGVTVTVPPGWTISDTGATWVLLRKADNSANMAASSGHADTPDISDESAFLFNQLVSKSGYTNVVQVAQPLQTVQGNHFNQALQVNFTADQQNNQGTSQVWGIEVTLYNAATQSSGQLWLIAYSPDALQAATPDAEAMLGSML
jgi:hypothetical protein